VAGVTYCEEAVLLYHLLGGQRPALAEPAGNAHAHLPDRERGQGAGVLTKHVGGDGVADDLADGVLVLAAAVLGA
jgi:hypothetical protein